MKYHVSAAGHAFEVEIDGSRIVVDGVEVAARLSPVPGTPLHHLTLDGMSRGVAAEPREEPGCWAIGAGGEWIAVEVVDERSRSLAALTGRRAAVTGGGTLVAPMPGLVVRVEVAEGQHVAAGDGLVVIEAMKMENELRAAHAGVVAKVHVRAGAAVEKGAILVTLKSVEPTG